jgi:hypothetical protein
MNKLHINFIINLSHVKFVMKQHPLEEFFARQILVLEVFKGLQLSSKLKHFT